MFHSWNFKAISLEILGHFLSFQYCFKSHVLNWVDLCLHNFQQFDETSNCSSSWSCLVNKYSYEIVGSLKFLSNTNIAWRGWASILSSTTLQLDKICHDVSLIFTCKKHKHGRYTIQFDQRQNNFSQRQKYKCGWRSSWKHVLPPCFWQRFRPGLERQKSRDGQLR